MSKVDYCSLKCFYLAETKYKYIYKTITWVPISAELLAVTQDKLL